MAERELYKPFVSKAKNKAVTLGLSSLLYRSQPPPLLVQSPYLHARVRFVHNAVSVRLISFDIACFTYLHWCFFP